MTYWPEGMAVDPIGEWPGAMTVTRTRSNFASPLSSTLDTLHRELRALRGKNARLQIAVDPAKFRQDGYPRAGAVPTHPGIILTLDSMHGALSYPCDTFTTWQDNLRAIALALEALRKVDRYGVTKRGEQYRGFLALEATAAPAGFATAQDAHAYLLDIVRAKAQDGSDDTTATTLRRAKRITHPDTGGDPAAFQRVSLAEARLREEGLL